jgi:hypothetical protein
MIAELFGGVVTDYLLRRTRSQQIARSLLIAVSWGFVLAGLVPAILVHDLAIGLADFTPGGCPLHSAAEAASNARYPVARG